MHVVHEQGGLGRPVERRQNALFIEVSSASEGQGKRVMPWLRACECTCREPVSAGVFSLWEGYAVVPYMPGLRYNTGTRVPQALDRNACMDAVTLRCAAFCVPAGSVCHAVLSSSVRS